jgi:poly-gamma-glutamate synthesis protein (capsule biosynthesis protein)
MCHSVQFDYAKTAQDSFNFNPVFSLVKKYISAADIACGNLETVTAGEKAKYTGYPNFNSPDEFVDAIKNAGFDLLFTANNHALDRGEKGVRQTIALIRNLGINQTGTFLSRRDRDSIRILNIKGIRTAFLAYSYGENGHYIPKTRTYIINLIDTTLIREDISSARKTGADIVVVYFHFGEEYHRTPSDYQENIVKASIHYGADIIIASHPHVVEPAIFFKTEDNQIDSGYAVYSLGNFISNQRKRYTDGGVILTIGITKNITKDSIYISKINYRPTWVYKGEYKGKRQFIIVPDDSADIDSIKIWLTPYKKSQMMRSFKDTKEILKIKDKEPSKMENLR